MLAKLAQPQPPQQAHNTAAQQRSSAAASQSSQQRSHQAAGSRQQAAASKQAADIRRAAGSSSGADRRRRRHGDTATRRHGDTATRRHGDNTRHPITTPSDQPRDEPTTTTTHRTDGHRLPMMNTFGLRRLPLLLLRHHQPQLQLQQRRWLRSIDRDRDPRDRVSALVTALDDDADRLPPAVGPKGRLQKALEAAPKDVALPAAAQGQLDAFGEDLADLLNEAIASKALAATFRGASSSSDVVEIKQVTVNRDRSHVTAFWSSSILNGFAQLVHDSPSSGHSRHPGTTASPNDDSNEGDDDENSEASQVWLRGVRYINRKLQQREPQFRAFLCRKVHFRKVPRVFFRVYDPELDFVPGFAASARRAAALNSALMKRTESYLRRTDDTRGGGAHHG